MAVHHWTVQHPEEIPLWQEVKTNLCNGRYNSVLLEVFYHPQSICQTKPSLFSMYEFEHYLP